jgi:hypothetical protein
MLLHTILELAQLRHGAAHRNNRPVRAASERSAGNIGEIPAATAPLSLGLPIGQSGEHPGADASSNVAELGATMCDSQLSIDSGQIPDGGHEAERHARAPCIPESRAETAATFASQGMCDSLISERAGAEVGEAILADEVYLPTASHALPHTERLER